MKLLVRGGGREKGLFSLAWGEATVEGGFA